MRYLRNEALACGKRVLPGIIATRLGDVTDREQELPMKTDTPPRTERPLSVFSTLIEESIFLPSKKKPTWTPTVKDSRIGEIDRMITSPSDEYKD